MMVRYEIMPRRASSRTGKLSPGLAGPTITDLIEDEQDPGTYQYQNQVLLCFLKYDTMSSLPVLLRSQYLRPPLLCRFLLLVSPLERCSRGMISADIVKIFDLINADDPVLARESFFDGVENGSDFRQLHATDSVLSLSRRKERVVVVV